MSDAEEGGRVIAFPVARAPCCFNKSIGPVGIMPIKKSSPCHEMTMRDTDSGRHLDERTATETLVASIVLDLARVDREQALLMRAYLTKLLAS